MQSRRQNRRRQSGVGGRVGGAVPTGRKAAGPLSPPARRPPRGCCLAPQNPRRADVDVADRADSGRGPGGEVPPRAGPPVPGLRSQLGTRPASSSKGHLAVSLLEKTRVGDAAESGGARCHMGLGESLRSDRGPPPPPLPCGASGQGRPDTPPGGTRDGAFLERLSRPREKASMHGIRGFAGDRADRQRPTAKKPYTDSPASLSASPDTDTRPRTDTNQKDQK